MIAKQQIRELVLHYCRAVDRRDYDMLYTLYHQDSVDEHGGMFCGSGRAFVDWLPGILESMKITSHSVTNHLIAVQGSEAEGEVMCTAYHLTGDNQEIIIGGRYLDKYICVAGRWLFKHRKIVMDWNRIQPSAADFTSPAVAGTPVGGVLAQDPSSCFFDYLFRNSE